MEHQKERLCHYLTLILALISAAFAGYFIYLQSRERRIVIWSDPSLSLPGWKLMDLKEPEIGIWLAGLRVPPGIASADRTTQFAWALLWLCVKEPDEVLLRWDPTWLTAADHPFSRLVAMGEKAAPACIEMFRNRWHLGYDLRKIAVVDLVLLQTLAGRQSARVRELFWNLPYRAPERYDPNERLLWVVGPKLERRVLAWIEWYDNGMRTPLPPLVQRELDEEESQALSQFDPYLPIDISEMEERRSEMERQILEVRKKTEDLRLMSGMSKEDWERALQEGREQLGWRRRAIAPD